jgi:hypothetical protein
VSVAYADTAARSRPASFARARRAAMFVWRFIIGVLFCQSLVGALAAVGWTYRWMQRSALLYWWHKSGLESQGGNFAAFAAGDALTVPHVGRPKWFVNQAPIVAAGKGSVRGFLSYYLGSLWLNLRTGFLAVVNTLVITGPASALWIFSWYAGWDNSFNKGYEQAPVGPITGFSGVGLFMLAMMYVPIAQARQAISGNWRAFYQFRLNVRLLRTLWMPMLLLAGVYTAASIPVHGFRVFPYFLDINNADFAQMTASEKIQFMGGYYFWSTLVVLALYIALHLFATRIYAAGVLRALKSERVEAEELSVFERRALERLGLVVRGKVPDRHALIRAVVGGGTWFARTSSIVALLIVWFMFTAQIFVAQFINYQPGRAWINQPLVHAPWLKYIPDHLQEAAKAEQAARKS